MKTKIEVGDTTLDIEVLPTGESVVTFTRGSEYLGTFALRQRGVNAMDMYLSDTMVYHAQCNRSRVATITRGRVE